MSRKRNGEKGDLQESEIIDKCFSDSRQHIFIILRYLISRVKGKSVFCLVKTFSICMQYYCEILTVNFSYR